jgi:hypothetical protein
MSGLPKRIIKESERLVKEPVQGISATPHDDNLRYFDVTIDGPSQSPYEGESGASDGRSCGTDIIQAASSSSSCSSRTTTP